MRNFNYHPHPPFCDVACPYCEEFDRGYHLFKGENLGNRILHESDNFVVFPSLGQIVEGYLLIASKNHLVGLSDISELHFCELECVIEEVRKVLAKNYSEPIFFEHGPVNGNKGGCCVNHAHLHAVPAKVSISDYLIRIGLEPNPLHDLLMLRFQSKIDKEYFYVDDSSGRLVFDNLRDALGYPESQYLRKVLAAQLGVPEKWDWRVYPGIEELQRTKIKLADKFNSSL